jgi:hypothetical protein
MYKYGVYFIWKKRRFLIEKYISELMWIYDVDIYWSDGGLCVNGIDDDVNSCLCVVESLLLGWKGGYDDK